MGDDLAGGNVAHLTRAFHKDRIDSVMAEAGAGLMDRQAAGRQ